MRRGSRVLAPILACTLILAGCASADWSDGRAAPTAEGAPGPGFMPAAEPSPEATVTPTNGSWDSANAPAGYRVVLLTAGDDAPSLIVADAVRSWADQEDVDLREIPSDDDPISGIVAAIEMNPELIISAGNDLIDALTTVSAHHLDEQFLIVGAEIPEPTENVTAVDWTGASFRGNGLTASSEFDETTFTPERSANAVRAGVAAVLTGMTGIVLWIG